MDEKKIFLSQQGLELYDSLLKAYINNARGEDQASVEALIQQLGATVEQNTNSITANTEAIGVLNGTGEGSVSKQVEDAIASLVNGAPAALDTLKEIASWISDNEEGATALIERVKQNEQDIEALTEQAIQNTTNLKSYIDAQDKYYWNNIDAIEELKIQSLFATTQAADKTAVDAIAEIEEGKALKLTANQTIHEDITIDKSCYIDANGSKFSGVVIVPADKDVIIVNATFDNPVVVE